MIQTGQLVAVLALLVALLFAGCGGNARKTFRERQLRPLEQRVDDQRARLAALMRVVRPGRAADARALRAAATPLAESGRLATSLQPPPAAVKPLRAYAAAAAGLAAQLHAFAAVLAHGGATKIDAAAARVRDAIGALQSARIALDQAVAG